MSIKPVTVAECDPDLDMALEALRYIVPRYRAVGAKALDADSDPQRYREMAALRHERADLRDTISLQAERLNLKPDALIRLVEAAEPLLPRGAGRGKRKSPTVNALLANVSTGESYAAKAAEEARVEWVFAKHAAKKTADAVAEYGAAREYLEASRG